MSEMNKVNAEDLEQVTGGYSGSGDWVYGVVHGVIHYDASSCLTLRNAPDGAVMYTDAGKPLGWQNGDVALIQPSSRQGNWVRAQINGVTGWTNINYVRF